MHWFCAIRAAKIKLVKETFPERPLEQVWLDVRIMFEILIQTFSNSVLQIQKNATRDFLQHGYLCKTPPDLSVSIIAC